MKPSSSISETSVSPRPMSAAECSRARLSRDARFDGLFYVAVKTTGIFCRPICPAESPREANVEYFEHSAKAFLAGYRPCLRCRPDSAPGSCAWRGTDTTYSRALSLIDAGALCESDVPSLAARLGIGDRYLRRLFQERLGLSPKAYALFGQIMFAKKLLHETSLSISVISDAAGFHSLRRFNDAFKKHMRIAPTEIRRNQKQLPTLNLTLAYRPPLDWNALLTFWQKRCVNGIEWVSGKSYGRRFTLRERQSGGEARGTFEVEPLAGTHTLELRVRFDKPSMLKQLIVRVRQILDLDADIHLIEQQLSQVSGFNSLLKTGLRIPGIWHPFEAGVRAILGQQVSVSAARTHLERLVAELGEVADVVGFPAREDAANSDIIQQRHFYFPTPLAIAGSDLAMLKMPKSRREALKRFAAWYLEGGENQPITDWLQLKGIGNWTVDYVQMRALGHPDIWLASDLGIRKALARLNGREPSQGPFDSEQLRPWRSYATFHLWNHSVE